MCIMQLSNGLFTREQLFGESSQNTCRSHVWLKPTFGEVKDTMASLSRSDSAFSAWPIDKANTVHHIAAKYGPCAAWLLYYLSARVAGKAGRVWAAHGKCQIFGDIN